MIDPNPSPTANPVRASYAARYQAVRSRIERRATVEDLGIDLRRKSPAVRLIGSAVRAKEDVSDVDVADHHIWAWRRYCADRQVHGGRLTIEDIQRAVCAHYGVTRSDMLAQRRIIIVARPRQIAMYLARHLTLLSSPEIGRRFNGRDHSTVLHAVEKIALLRATDPQLDKDLAFLTSDLRARFQLHESIEC